MRTKAFHTFIVLMLALAGAFYFQAFTHQASAEEMPQAVTLALGDYRFDPNSIEVQSGRPIILTLINTDGITPHDFTLYDTTAGLDISTSVSAGSTSITKFTPEVPGTYTFYCSKKLPFMKSHRAHGMEGTLIVR
jgi:plastocyanin